MYALIMASGQGTRLWPLSRAGKPKQFHPLISEKTLLRETYERVAKKFSPEQIYVAVTEQYYKIAKKELPEMLKRNFIVEPFTTGTAGTIGLATAVINQTDPEAAIVCLPSDHLMRDPTEFIKTLDFAEEIIAKFPKEIIQVGIKPSEPDTGLGYIEMGKLEETGGRFSAFRVKRFVEKPDLRRAKKFVASEKFLWNGGIYIFRTDFMLKLYEKYLPRTAAALSVIIKSQNGYRTTLEYKNIDQTSLDYGIIEKIKNILVIPADFGWSDIGSWGTLLDVLLAPGKTKIISKGHHFDVDSENCLVISDNKFVATVGLKDIVVIDMPDALLVCDKNRAQEVKQIIDKLKESGEEKYL